MSVHSVSGPKCLVKRIPQYLAIQAQNDLSQWIQESSGDIDTDIDLNLSTSSSETRLRRTRVTSICATI